MLAERFQPDFYGDIAERAMVAEEGKVSELASLEEQAKKGPKQKKTDKKM